MNCINKDALIDWLLTANVMAMLVDTTKAPAGEPRMMGDIPGKSGIGQVLRNKRVVDGVFYADDMTFPAVKTRVGACVVCVDQRVLVYQDGIVDSPTDPKGGDVTVPFSNGVLAV